MGLVVTISSFALGKDSLNAITMVSYEQGWLDYNGTLALKNNTSQTIDNVAFRITYLNMKGKPMDYKDFSLKIHIPSGLTKKVDIEAYEHGRNYSYYTSEAYYRPRRFKIKFQLQGYNLSETQIDQSDLSKKDKLSDRFNRQNVLEENPNDTAMNITSIVVALFVLSFYIGFDVLIAQMAKSRHRNVALWVLISLFITPILAMIVLAVIGNDKDREYI